MREIPRGLRIAVLAMAASLFAPILWGEAAISVHVDAAGTEVFTDAPSEPSSPDLSAIHEGERPATDPSGVAGYADLIRRIAGEERVDPDLVWAIIQVESNFDARAISPKGARGLMQLMPATAAQFAVPDAFDPEANIRGGAQYLRALQGRFPGRLPLVLAAYNAGENAVLRYQGIPPFTETRRYVERVLALYEKRPNTLRATWSGPSSGVALSEAPESTAPVPSIIQAVDGDGIVVYTTSSASIAHRQRGSR